MPLPVNPEVHFFNDTRCFELFGFSEQLPWLDGCDVG
jgi:hypothetical protein